MYTEFWKENYITETDMGGYRRQKDTSVTNFFSSGL